MIQFRDKVLNDEAFRETAKRVLRMTCRAGVPLIVNDRVKIGIEIGADGVHIGSDDGDAQHIRATLPSHMIFGVSARCFDEALAMDRVGADYLGVGPIFPTLSKSDASQPMGMAELKRVIDAIRTPVMVIGGVNATTLPACIAAGVKGASVISAVTRAPEMTAATKELMQIWNTPV